ncbi:hypothetical protein NVP1101O_032 [Vibrio phage 1.101.O._10N.261.45.C6]|nr:hypothetical protein NVP1101O_032 [Vibrio phage 1.101.O._10N.261.45.C6]
MTVTVGNPNVKMNLEEVESLARDAGFSDEYIESFDGDAKTLHERIMFKIASLKEKNKEEK